MAEAFLRSFDERLDVVSAGTRPEKETNPRAIAVMKEIGFDISRTRTKSVEEFLSDKFDYVITVCDDARETCPVFAGEVKFRRHYGFEDPAKAKGSEEEILRIFRKIRDEIRETFKNFYEKEIGPKLET